MHLYEVLERHPETVLRRWERRSRVLPDARPLNRQDLRDSLPALLADMAAAARRGDRTIGKDRPCDHATQRWAHDYDITELVAEYQLLHEAILDEWSERSGDQLPGREVRMLQGFVGKAVQIAVDAYAQEHARFVAESQAYLQQALEETRAAEQQLDTVVEQMAECVGLCDAEGRLVRMNEAARRLHGRIAEGDEAATWAERFDTYRPDGSPLPVDEMPLIRALRGETVRGADVLVCPSGGVPTRMQVNAVPLRGPNGRLLGALAVGRDVTEEVRAQEMERQLRANTQRRAEFAQQLVNIVSHDLRTPLGAILLSANWLLRQGALDERQASALRRIVSSAERAQRLVRDLLAFAFAGLGEGLPLECAATDLRTLVTEVLEEARILYPDRPVVVEHQGETTGDWDSDRLTQVVGNLVHNALKYSPPDSAVYLRTWEKGPAIGIAVHNDGPPIPPDTQAHLFEPLLRGNLPSNGREHGVGLGLFIVRAIVEAHGGAVEVQSVEAEGTTFTVRLPRQPPAQGECPGD